MEYLQKWNEARQAIAEANSVDELSAIIDMAEAYRYALKQAKEGLDVVNKATEIKLRAERKAGEFFQNLGKPNHGGDRKTDQVFQHRKLENDKTEVIKNSGITIKTAYEWQKVASIPDEKFEQHIIEIQQENEELTRAKLLRVAQEELAPRPKEQEYKKPQTIFINVDDPIEALLNNILNTAIRYRDAGRLHEIIDYLKISISNHQKSKLS